MIYKFDVKEYSNFMALYFIISHKNIIDKKDFPHESLKAVIPP